MTGDRVCVCCGGYTYSGSYCDPCNTDRCMGIDEDGNDYCRIRAMNEGEGELCDYAGCYNPAQGDGRPFCIAHHNTDEGEGEE